MKTYAPNTADAAVVFGVEPFKSPETGEWQFPDQVHECLDTAAELLENGTVARIIVSGNRAVRQRYVPGKWHPKSECDMAEEYLVAKGCPPPLKEDISEDCASNHVYTTRLALSLGMERLIGITTPAREQRALYFGHLVVSPHCQFDVVTIDHQGTPAEIAQHEQTLKIQQYAFMDIKPGDLNALEARFYDGEPYGYFKYLDLAKAYSEKLAAQLT